MNFNFENYLLQELHSDKVKVQSEQMFTENGTLEPDKIYVVTKYLTSSIEFGAETAPVQILILSEQNGLQEAKELFEEFTQTHNWKAIYSENTFIKQQYSSPVVMSNFNEAAYGYRSVLYISCTLFLMENVVDVQDLEIDGIPIKPLNFNWSYQMTGNTQPIGGDKIASTVKNMATFQATMSIPVLDSYIKKENLTTVNLSSEPASYYYPTGLIPNERQVLKATLVGGTITSIVQNNGYIVYTLDPDADAYKLTFWLETNLLDNLTDIASGKISGNIDLNLTFSVHNISFDFDCKLVSLQMTSMPNDVPTLQVGLQR